MTSEALNRFLATTFFALLVALILLVAYICAQKVDLWPWPVQRQEGSPYTAKEILGGYYDGSTYHLRIIDRYSDGRLWERDVVIPEGRITRDFAEDERAFWDFGSNVSPRFHIRTPEGFISNEPAQ